MKKILWLLTVALMSPPVIAGASGNQSGQTARQENTYRYQVDAPAMADANNPSYGVSGQEKNTYRWEYNHRNQNGDSNFKYRHQNRNGSNWGSPHRGTSGNHFKSKRNW